MTRMRGRMALHHAQLRIASVSAKKRSRGDVKGVLHIACRMILRKVQPFEIVVVRFDLGSELHREAHAGEDLDQLIHHQCDRMFAS